MRVLIPQGLYSETGSKSSRTKGWSSVQDFLKPQLPGRREGSEHTSLVGELPSPEPSGDLNCKLRLPIPARSWQTEAAPPSKSSNEQQPPAWKHLDFWRFVNVQCEYVILVTVPKSKQAILSCFTWASHAHSWQVTFYYTLTYLHFQDDLSPARVKSGVEAGTDGITSALRELWLILSQMNIRSQKSQNIWKLLLPYGNPEKIKLTLN